MPDLDHAELERSHSGHYNTDIHLFVEYPLGDDGAFLPLADKGFYYPTCGDLVALEALAGLCTGEAHLTPKGFPPTLSEEAFYATHLSVVSGESSQRHPLCDYLLHSDYEKNYASKHPLLAPPDFACETDFGYVVDPEIFSPSHLTLAELEDLIRNFNLEGRLDPVFWCTVESLRVLTKTYGSKSRVVIWFTS